MTSSHATIPGAGPAFIGYVETTADALRIVRAAVDGTVPRTSRRLSASERHELVKSGAVFVFSVIESGIKRWTDGLLWTPSRIKGNFLIYKQLEKKGAPRCPLAEDGEPQTAEHGNDTMTTSSGEQSSRVDGLIKKTISISLRDMELHLVSYYTQDDVTSGNLKTSRETPALVALHISPRDFQLDKLRSPPRLEVRPDGQLFLVDEKDNIALGEQDTPRASTSSERFDNAGQFRGSSTIMLVQLGLSGISTAAPNPQYRGAPVERSAGHGAPSDTLDSSSLPPTSPPSSPPQAQSPRSLSPVIHHGEIPWRTGSQSSVLTPSNSSGFGDSLSLELREHSSREGEARRGSLRSLRESTYMGQQVRADQTVSATAERLEPADPVMTEALEPGAAMPAPPRPINNPRQQNPHSSKRKRPSVAAENTMSGESSNSSVNIQQSRRAQASSNRPASETSQNRDTCVDPDLDGDADEDEDHISLG